jgi:hypothetical protein
VSDDNWPYARWKACVRGKHGTIVAVCARFGEFLLLQLVRGRAAMRVRMSVKAYLHARAGPDDILNLSTSRNRLSLAPIKQLSGEVG